MTKFSSASTFVTILFGHKEKKYYSFRIRADQYYSLFKGSFDGGESPIIAWTHLPIKFEPDKMNKMVVLVNDGEIGLYLNSKMIGEQADREFAGGEVLLGAGAGNSGTSAVIEFGNFEMWRKTQ